ncbi:MAG: hypothetical protein AAGE96_15430 [Cyanobacteria bacterium P01_G01_bin.19]
MSHTKHHANLDASIDSNKVEFEENKMLLWLEKFWQFSLFYGNYLGSLHARKNNKLS